MAYQPGTASQRILLSSLKQGSLALLLAVTLAGLAGCGKKGPLTQPEQPVERQQQDRL